MTVLKSNKKKKHPMVFWPYGTIIIGTASLVFFIVRQFKLEISMLDFRIYNYPNVQPCFMYFHLA